MADIKLPQLNNKEEVLTFLKEAPVQLAEVVTGILGSESTEWKMSAGRIIQSALKGNLLTCLGNELKKYKDKGEIKDDFLATDATRMALNEILKMIDGNDIPDEIKFRSIKSIFISGINTDSTNEDEFLAYEFLRTAVGVSGTEVLILKANFAIANKQYVNDVGTLIEKNASPHSRQGWANIVSKQMGLQGFNTLVSKYEENLEKLGLISPRNYDNRFSSEFIPTNKFRLSEMGYKFCQFMTKYEK